MIDFELIAISPQEQEALTFSSLSRSRISRSADAVR
jgi:hypothetical protein